MKAFDFRTFCPYYSRSVCSFICLAFQSFWFAAKSVFNDPLWDRVDLRCLWFKRVHDILFFGDAQSSSFHKTKESRRDHRIRFGHP